MDHAELLETLQTFDGWALSTSSRSLRAVLELCPADVRILVWLNHAIGRSWEPVLVSAARPVPTRYRPLDWLQCEPEAFQWAPPPPGYVIGRKPRAFCRWMFRWLGAVPGEDELEDLYPGSGAVGQAWEEWNQQPELPQLPGRRDVRRWARDRPGWLELELEREEGSA